VVEGEQMNDYRDKIVEKHGTEIDQTKFLDQCKASFEAFLRELLISFSQRTRAKEFEYLYDGMENNAENGEILFASGETLSRPGFCKFTSEYNEYYLWIDLEDNRMTSNNATVCGKKAAKKIFETVFQKNETRIATFSISKGIVVFLHPAPKGGWESIEFKLRICVQLMQTLAEK